MTYRSRLSEEERLKLICEAVRYCQRVRAMGMVPGGWTKALREAIFFMWEVREANKKGAARFRSIAASGTEWGGHRVVYDHAIPFNYVQNDLLALAEPDPAGVRDILDRRLVACLITREEDRLLASKKLSRAMPANWDGIDPLARYEAAEIRVEPNPNFGKRGRALALDPAIDGVPTSRSAM
jgi:hypothetical protein